MQYHFVVMYDESEDKFYFDSGTTWAKFGDGNAVFDSETNNWYEMDELMEADFADYSSMLVEKLDGVY